MNADLRSVSRTNLVVVLALIVVAPVAWFTHLAISYALVPWACRLGSDLPLHVATILALVGLGTSGTIAVRSAPDGATTREWIRLLMSDSAGLPPERRTLPLVAVAFAAYFALVVAMTGLVPVVVDRCA